QGEEGGARNRAARAQVPLVRFEARQAEAWPDVCDRILGSELRVHTAHQRRHLAGGKHRGQAGVSCHAALPWKPENDLSPAAIQASPEWPVTRPARNGSSGFSQGREARNQISLKCGWSK